MGQEIERWNGGRRESRRERMGEGGGQEEEGQRKEKEEEAGQFYLLLWGGQTHFLVTGRWVGAGGGRVSVTGCDRWSLAILTLRVGGEEGGGWVCPPMLEPSNHASWIHLLTSMLTRLPPKGPFRTKHVPFLGAFSFEIRHFAKTSFAKLSFAKIDFDKT